MKTKIELLAEKIISNHESEINAKKAEFEISRKKEESELLSEFKQGFASQLELLDDARIVYTAHFNSEWRHHGAYIKFKCLRSGKELKMDFNNRNSYRYEYTGNFKDGSYASMVYGKWDMERFVMFIYDGLLK